MDERRNNRQVERRLKEALRSDRARIQVGRISAFGLLEMSRQRLRTGVLEGSTNACPMCQGTGIVRSVESVALDILRSIEDRLITDGVAPLSATTAVEVAIYILNQKRAHLKDIETRYEVPISIEASQDLHTPQFVIERSTDGGQASGDGAVVQMDWAHHREDSAQAGNADGESGKRRSRRRRRGRGRGESDGESETATSEASASGDDTVTDDTSSETADVDGEQQPRKSRRRGRRGGRRGRGRGQRTTEPTAEQEEGQNDEAVAKADNVEAEVEPAKQPATAAVDTPDMDVDDDVSSANADISDDKPVREVAASEYLDEENASKPAEETADEVVGGGSEGAEDAPSPRSKEPALSIASSREEPVAPAAKPEIRIESESDKEPVRQRKGWWSRG